PDSRRISLLSQFRGKAILRRIASDLVGESTIAKRKRGFFRSAASAWVATNSELVRETLLDPRTLDRGLFDRRGVAALLEPTSRLYRQDQIILSLVMLEKWQRLFIDGTRA